MHENRQTRTAPVKQRGRCAKARRMFGSTLLKALQLFDLRCACQALAT